MALQFPQWRDTSVNFSGSNASMQNAQRGLSQAGNVFDAIAKTFERQQDRQDRLAQQEIANSRADTLLGVQLDQDRRNQTLFNNTLQDRERALQLESDTEGFNNALASFYKSNPGLVKRDGTYDLDVYSNFLQTLDPNNGNMSAIGNEMGNNYLKHNADILARNNQAAIGRQLNPLQEAQLRALNEQYENAQFEQYANDTLNRYIRGTGEDAQDIRREMEQILNDPNTSAKQKSLARNILQNGDALRLGEQDGVLLSPDDRQALYANTVLGTTGSFPQITPYASDTATREAEERARQMVQDSYNEARDSIVSGIENTTGKPLNTESRSALIKGGKVLMDLGVPAQVYRDAVENFMEAGQTGIGGFGSYSTISNEYIQRNFFRPNVIQELNKLGKGDINPNSEFIQFIAGRLDFNDREKFLQAIEDKLNR